MNGYGSHTFKLINVDGEAVYCKFHYKVRVAFGTRSERLPPPHLLPSREGWAEIKKIKASPTFLSFHPQGWGVWIYLITTRRIFLSPTWSPCPNRRPMCDLFLVSPFHVARGQNHKAVHSQAFFFQTLVTPPYMFGRMFLLCASFLVQCFWCWQVCIEISSLWREKIEFFDLVSNVRSKYRPLG